VSFADRILGQRGCAEVAHYVTETVRREATPEELTAWAVPLEVLDDRQRVAAGLQ
jgi:hypothetical protein